MNSQLSVFVCFMQKNFKIKEFFQKSLEKIPVAALITKRFPAAAAAADRLRVFQSHRRGMHKSLKFSAAAAEQTVGLHL
jgi:hypothetical protein